MSDVNVNITNVCPPAIEVRTAPTIEIQVFGKSASSIDLTQPPTLVLDVKTIMSPVILVNPIGEKGMKGDKGDPGETGADGSAPKSYTHDQSVPASEWNVIHNLGFYPNVSVVDSSQRKILTDVKYIDQDSLIIIVDSAFSGKAYLS